MRTAARRRCFLWGHCRSFPHIEVLAGAAAAGVCMCSVGGCYVTAAPPTDEAEPVHLLRPVFLSFSAVKTRFVILHFNTRLNQMLVLCRTNTEPLLCPAATFNKVCAICSCGRFIYHSLLSSSFPAVLSTRDVRTILPVSISVKKMNCSNPAVAQKGTPAVSFMLFNYSTLRFSYTCIWIWVYN